MRVLVLAAGLATLAASPALALTIQAAPPRPDLALHLSGAQRTQDASSNGSVSFSASGTSYDRWGTPYSFGAPAYSSSQSMQIGGALPSASTFIDQNFRQPTWTDAPMSRRPDTGNPLSLVPPRH